MAYLSSVEMASPLSFITSIPLIKATERRLLCKTSPSRSQNRRCATRAVQEAGDQASIEPKPETPFPVLYDAWFPPNELSIQMQKCVERAVTNGHTLLELQWPVVPNLEEIAAGTLLNFKFGKHVSRVLGMDEPKDYMLIKRYLAPFCNLYWTLCLSQTPCFRDRVVWAVSTDGVSKTAAEGQLKNVRLASMRNPPETGDDDVLVIIDPRVNDVWKRGAQLRPKNGYTVFLNSQFNESYGLTGPRRGVLKDTQVAYMLKRVTRGYVFYAYPGPWRACLEKPDLGIEELKCFEKEPKLRDIAAVVRLESNRRYGSFYNDRYVRGFGGRL
ncbi:hypothetical protein BWQ96_02704 [Gracilariopsis chorda]|uniref:DUF1995 domain-containing protein n=1 Tax=Gracilariopsis chorda TaxID=448386 RepID=A0A2V3J2E3_9FLOR|nr:hypothetical protein BWQ96_02704 [Gracilariopsis chorda]|eukprot:PXF47560.1 hypothetical protein BWQ96_02704 [Gracilariopsis chorda]